MIYKEKETKVFNDYGFGADENIPDRFWNSYLKKYSDKYRMKRDECGLWYIISKNGQIKPFSIVNSTLGAYFTLTNRKKNFLMRKLPFFMEVFQEGDGCLSLKFPEDNLEELEEFLEIKKKKLLSPEHIEKLRANLRQYRRDQNGS